MTTVLISGAASGLGRAFLEFFLHTSRVNTIIAIDRSPIAPIPNNAKLQIYETDVTSSQSISSFAQRISDVPIDLFIHSAGIRGLVPAIETEHPDNVAKAETLESMDVETMMRTFQINTAGTLSLIQALLGNFQLASQNMQSPAKVVIMGSRMGSISYNTVGGGYAYRASKAGLHAIIKSLSIDVPNVIFTILHPGRVETGLVKCREEGAIEADESVTDMIKVIEKLTSTDSGRLYDRFGDAIGW